MSQTKLIIFASVSIFAAACIISMAVYAKYGYVAKLNTLESGDCIIVVKDKQYEQAGCKSDTTHYFYRPGSGHKAYIWLCRKYYTINFQMAQPAFVNDDLYYRTFKDGYRHEEKRNEVYDNVVLNYSTVHCVWDKTNPKHLWLTKSAHMTKEIVGICFLTVIAFLAIIAAVFAGVIAFY